MSNLEPVKALNLDLGQQLSFIRFYRNLPEKTASTIRFFNHSDYYSVHGDDALVAAEQVFNTNLVKYMGEAPKLSYVCLSQNSFEKFVRELLLVKQYRVEVYVKPTQSKNNDWIVEYKASPGNLQQFEELLFDNNEATITGAIMGVKLGKANTLGLSCVNMIESTFSVVEIVDNEYYTEFEALIAQLTPKECVIPIGESVELKSLHKVLIRNDVLVVRAKKADYTGDDLVQDLDRLLYFADEQHKAASSLPEFNKKDAMESLQAVIKYLNLIGDDQNFNQYKLTTLETGRFVRLDNAAINALNLVNKPGVPLMNKFDTLYGLLNSCSTQQGRRLLEKWIKQPIRDINLLSERLDVVEMIYNDSEVRNTLSNYALNKIPDLMMLAKKLSTKKGKLQDCYKVYQTIQAVPALVGVLRNTQNTSVKALLVDPICEVLTDLEKYQSMIERTLDLDLVDRGEYFIKPMFDTELKDLHTQKGVMEEQMQRALGMAANDLGLDVGKSVKMDNTEQHGYYFRVTLKEEPVLRSNKKYEIIDAVKGGIRFTNSSMRELNEKYTELNDNYELKQKNVVEEILNVAAGYADSLRSLNSNIALVDVLVAFATAAMAAPIPYVRPKLLPMGSGILKLKKARHPCLEKQDGVNFIPNDVCFKQGVRNLFVLTGPNMGGKSTYMRTVGLAVLMAHIGSFVPCESAEISVVDCILARVGADDCELKGMSTFMLEMVETSAIVRSATSNSLVIIDELGRGTSTYDGCGIAWAIAEYLAQESKSFSLFATHYHEITQLEESIPSVVNTHVTALVTDKTVTPLYQVRDGVCDKSYGIHCARLAEFPEDVLMFATAYQKNLEGANGMKNINDFEPSIKKSIIDEGESIVTDALKIFEDASSDISDEELMRRVETLKEQLAGQDNLYVRGLMEMKK